MVETRSDAWTPTTGGSSGAIFRSRTDEVLPRTMQVPAPMFVLAFASATSGFLGSATVEPAPAAPQRLPLEPRAAIAAERPPEPGAPPPDPDDMPQTPLAGETAQAPNRADRIELIIDSLHRHQLIAPIPVTVDALGDKVYTATVLDLDITATGHSVGEALLLLKEQIVTVYEDLTRAADLNGEQRRTLGFLQDYIARNPRRPGWGYRR